MTHAEILLCASFLTMCAALGLAMRFVRMNKPEDFGYDDSEKDDASH